jgi:hypothetical protein
MFIVCSIGKSPVVVARGGRPCWHAGLPHDRAGDAFQMLTDLPHLSQTKLNAGR